MTNIKIIVERQSASSSESGADKSPSKGIIRRKPEDEILGRRKKKSENFIKFYDLRYLKTGVDISITNGQDEIEESDHAALAAQILSHSLDDFQDVQKGIALFKDEFQADGYFPFDYNSIEVYGDSFDYLITDSLLEESDASYHTNWTANGLKLSSEELAEENIYIGEIQIKGDGRNKITSVNDYSAADVSFNPTAKMDVFVMPKILLAQGSSEYYKIAEDEGVFLEADKYKMIYPGASVWNKDAPKYGKAFGGDWVSGGGYDENDYFNAYEGIETLDFYGIDMRDLIPEEGFPVPPNSPYVPTASGYPLQLHVFQTESDIENVLCLIIRQNGNLFYVWT